MGLAVGGVRPVGRRFSSSARSSGCSVPSKRWKYTVPSPWNSWPCGRMASRHRGVPCRRPPQIGTPRSSVNRFATTTLSPTRTRSASPGLKSPPWQAWLASTARERRTSSSTGTPTARSKRAPREGPRSADGTLGSLPPRSRPAADADARDGHLFPDALQGRALAAVLEPPADLLARAGRLPHRVGAHDLAAGGQRLHAGRDVESTPRRRRRAKTGRASRATAEGRPRAGHHTRTRAAGSRNIASPGFTSNAPYHASMLRTVSAR